MDVATGQRIIALRGRIVGNFTQANWHELGLLTGGSRFIDGHDRLLRSLAWGDEDYDGNVLDVLMSLPRFCGHHRYEEDGDPWDGDNDGSSPRNTRPRWSS